MVTSIDDIIYEHGITIEYDINHNGVLDYVKNDWNHPGNEVRLFFEQLALSSVTAHDVIVLPAFIAKYYVYEVNEVSTSSGGGGYITSIKLPENHGADLRTYEGNAESPGNSMYRPCYFDSGNHSQNSCSAAELIESIDGRIINLKHGVASASAFGENTNSVIYTGDVQGFSAKLAEDITSAGIWEDGRPAIICAPSNEYNFMRLAIHEISHAYGLSDVNRYGNIMHFTKKIVNQNLPFAYKALQPVITGSDIPDGSKAKQNQWEDYHRH